MIEEGALENPTPSAIFGLHVFPYPAGEIRYRRAAPWQARTLSASSCMAARPMGALPWAGIDPIVVASQIVLGLQTIASRQVDVTAAPAIVTVGASTGRALQHHPGQRVMLGTIRTFDTAMRSDIHQRVAVRQNRSRKARARRPRSSSIPRPR